MTGTGGSYTTASATGVWRIWTGATAITTGTSITTGTTDTVWDQWVNTSNITTTATTATASTWAHWMNQSTNDIRPQGQPIRSHQPETAEMVAERNRREAERRRLDEAARQETAKADERALRLLVGILDERQRKDMADHGHFFVDAPSGRRYRIDKGRSGNVKVIDRVTGVWIESLCIHQSDFVPVYDTMVMQKLLIETAEDEFRACANITRKDGSYDYSRGGLLTGERLANVLPFRREAREQALEVAA